MYFKGSYTVEAAVIVSMCIIIIGVCILTSFDIYKEVITYIDNTSIRNISASKLFRIAQSGGELVKDILE